MKAKSEMKKEHKLWEKASITDLKKSEKQTKLICPECNGEVFENTNLSRKGIFCCERCGKEFVSEELSK